MIRLALLLLALCFAWSSHAQQREQRVALVIGNGAYKSSPLRNPVNRLQQLRSALRSVTPRITASSTAVSVLPGLFLAHES